MGRSKVLSPACAAPYGKGLLEHGIVGASYQLRIKDGSANTYHKITKNTQVTMPVCPSDWATNDFAPFGNEAKLRGRNIQEYIKKHFQRGCTFFKRDGELYVAFQAHHIAHRELVFMRKAFFLDDCPHTFKEIGV